MSDLKPCHSCGSPVAWCGKRVCCSSRDCWMFNVTVTPEEWNRRASPASQDKVVEGLREAFKVYQVALGKIDKMRWDSNGASDSRNFIEACMVASKAMEDAASLFPAALAPEKKEATSAPSHNPEIEIELMAAELVRTVRKAVDDANAEWPRRGGGIRSLALANAAVAAAVEWSELNKKFMNYVATKIKSIGGDVGIICGGDTIKSTLSAEPLCVNCHEPESVHGIGGYYCKKFAPRQPVKVAEGKPCPRAVTGWCLTHNMMCGTNPGVECLSPNRHNNSAFPDGCPSCRPPAEKPCEPITSVDGLCHTHPRGHCPPSPGKEGSDGRRS